jgi:hypothetical protein
MRGERAVADLQHGVTLNWEAICLGNGGSARCQSRQEAWSVWYDVGMFFGDGWVSSFVNIQLPQVTSFSADFLRYNYCRFNTTVVINLRDTTNITP